MGFQQKQQKVDHGGNFYMTPRRVTGSVAWRECSFRARAVLTAFLHAFNGRNNGKLRFAIHDIGAAIGSKSHGPNARAVAELIEKGFLEMTSDANRAHAKARTYRITFVQTIETITDPETLVRKERMVPGTHEYDGWRPTGKRKFGGANIAPTSDENSTVSPPKMKDCRANIAPTVTESCGFDPLSLGGETPPLLYTIPPALDGAPDPLENITETARGDLRTDLAELRHWAQAVTLALGYGGNRKLASDAGITEVALSRFRHGKSLPDQYRLPLQEACARVVPYHKLAA